MLKKLSVSGGDTFRNFVNKDFDNPFENADEKGVAFAGMDLCFALGFYRILPVFPLSERFERHEVEIQAF